MEGRRFRWYEAAPEVALGCGLAVFLLTETDAATSALKSGRAVGLTVAVALAWVVARLLAWRWVPWAAARTAAFAVGAAAVLAVVVLPAYDDRTVVEAATESRTRVRVGAFRGIDHRAAGTVALYRTPPGRFVVGLEDIDIQPGPDYDVYVVPGADRDDRTGAVRLDDLRGNRGTQFYDVPPGVDLDRGPWTVLVWCQTFGVPIANATPA